jgi:hypothetical protein
MQNVEMADEIPFPKGQFAVDCINTLVRSQSFFPKMTCTALRHNIQHYCVRELGTRSETYHGGALTVGK